MNREIKFRAWDKKENKMFIPSSVSWKGKDMWVCDSHGENKLEHEIVNPNGLLMQFTGLQDKNGVDIYEGDVCMNEYGERGVISYYDGAFELCYFDEPAKEYLLEFVIKDKQYNSTGICSLIVKGNIHEQ